MKEKVNQNQTKQEAEWVSFFKIDSKTWPDLQPPTLIKPKNPRNPYKLLGIVNFNDRVLQKPQTPTVDRRWQIPQSKLKTEETHEEHNKDYYKETATPKMEIRAQAINLIRRLKTGEVNIDEVRDFYYETAEILVDQKPYLAHCDYVYQNKRKPLSWPEYAKRMAQELFISDLFILNDQLSLKRQKPPTRRLKLLLLMRKFLGGIRWKKKDDLTAKK